MVYLYQFISPLFNVFFFNVLFLAPDNLDSSGWLVYKFPGRHTERTPTILKDTPKLIISWMLRLVCGERATPFLQSAPSMSAPGPSVSGPRLSVFSQGLAHGAQQTDVSLAVLAMFQMLDYVYKYKI